MVFHLKRLMFVTQRAPNEFAADRSPTGLSAYLDEIRDVVKNNAAILKLAESIQVIYRPGASADFGKRIAAALFAAGTI
jgi:hypothetical protein